MKRFGAHMNRLGAKHVGEPAVMVESGRQACMYAAAMFQKELAHLMPDLTGYQALMQPPATVLLSREDDPSTVLTFVIPSRVLAYDPENAVRPMHASRPPVNSTRRLC